MKFKIASIAIATVLLITLILGALLLTRDSSNTSKIDSASTQNKKKHQNRVPHDSTTTSTTTAESTDTAAVETNPGATSTSKPNSQSTTPKTTSTVTTTTADSGVPAVPVIYNYHTTSMSGVTQCEFQLQISGRDSLNTQYKIIQDGIESPISFGSSTTLGSSFYFFVLVNRASNSDTLQLYAINSISGLQSAKSPLVNLTC